MTREEAIAALVTERFGPPPPPRPQAVRRETTRETEPSETVPPTQPRTPVHGGGA